MQNIFQGLHRWQMSAPLIARKESEPQIKRISLIAQIKKNKNPCHPLIHGYPRF